MKLSQSADSQHQLAVVSRSKSDQSETAPAGSEQQQQQLNNNSSFKPKVEDTVNLITNMLKERRRELDLPDGLEVGTAKNEFYWVLMPLRGSDRVGLWHLLTSK